MTIWKRPPRPRRTDLPVKDRPAVDVTLPGNLADAVRDLVDAHGLDAVRRELVRQGVRGRHAVLAEGESIYPTH